MGLAAGHSRARIARAIGRSPSTVSREIVRNSSSYRLHRSPTETAYRDGLARSMSDVSVRRPKESKPAGHPALLSQVQAGLTKRWSPEQIAARLVLDFPEDELMRISHETIYRSIYIQGHGGLNRELAKHLRTGRKLRKPRRSTEVRRGRIIDMVNISQRPAEAADRAVPGHWRAT